MAASFTISAIKNDSSTIPQPPERQHIPIESKPRSREPAAFVMQLSLTVRETGLVFQTANLNRKMEEKS
jgi:hypothetical protein